MLLCTCDSGTVWAGGWVWVGAGVVVVADEACGWTRAGMPHRQHRNVATHGLGRAVRLLLAHNAANQPLLSRRALGIGLLGRH